MNVPEPKNPARKRPPRQSQAERQDDQGVIQVDQGHRQDTQAARQKVQGATQVTQGATQDAQGLTQDAQAVTQGEQGLTQTEQGVTQIEQGVTQIKQGLMQADQADAIAANTVQILAITDGVGLLAANVERLNTGVYAKNKLDSARNRLILAAVIAFVVLSSVLAGLLWRLNDTAKAEARRAMDRSAEAVAVRHQLADCTTPPGTVLEEGYVNPGVCFTLSAGRTQSYIDSATAEIERDFREVMASLADAVATNKSLSAEVRRAAAAQAKTLREPAASPPVVVVQPPSASTPTTAPTPAPSPSKEQPKGLGAVLCAVLSLVGACG